MNTCFVCNGSRHHDMMYDVVLDDRIIYFGKTCHDEILIQYVNDWEKRDSAMTERMNRHEADYPCCLDKNEESTTIYSDLWENKRNKELEK